MDELDYIAYEEYVSMLEGVQKDATFIDIVEQGTFVRTVAEAKAFINTFGEENEDCLDEEWRRELKNLEFGGY